MIRRTATGVNRYAQTMIELIEDSPLERGDNPALQDDTDPALDPARDPALDPALDHHLPAEYRPLRALEPVDPPSAGSTEPVDREDGAAPARLEDERRVPSVEEQVSALEEYLGFDPGDGFSETVLAIFRSVDAGTLARLIERAKLTATRENLVARLKERIERYHAGATQSA